MSICQRKSGAWLVKYKDAVSGQWKQRQFKSREQAEEFDAAAKQAAEQNAPLTVMEAVAVYIQNHHLSDSRLARYDFLVNGYNRKNGTHTTGYAEHLAERYVVSLTRQDLESLRQRMQAAGIKAVTINGYVSMLKAVFAWCESEDLIPGNPWRKYRNIPEGLKRHLDGTIEELMQIYQYLHPCYQWAVRTAMALCLRPGMKELFALEWSAFDWRSRTATVWMPKVKRQKIVFLPDWYYPEARERCQADTAAGKKLVCRNVRDRQVSRMAWDEAWFRACKKAGLRIPPYAIRHIAASEMLCAGADMASVAAQLGHSNVATTAQYYIHALSRGQKQAALSLPDVTRFGG